MVNLIESLIKSNSDDFDHILHKFLNLEELISYTAEEATALVEDVKLSKRQYELIQKQAKAKKQIYTHLIRN